MKKYQMFTKQEKWSVVRRVENSANKTRELAKLNISKSTFYDWKKNNCEVKSKAPHHIWNKTPAEIEQKIKTYRLSGKALQQSPARIVEQLEYNERYIMAESGVKSVLTRLQINNLLRPRKKRYYIRPKAEKFLDVVSLDDVEFIRHEPRDTYVLNFTDEASYFALESRVYAHRTNSYNILKGLRTIKKTYGRYPKKIRLDNARAHKSRKVIRFCVRNNIDMDFITKGCPEENWPVESWHRNLNQDIIYRHGYSHITEWQKAIDGYRHYHNYTKRKRSDPIQRTPAEIAFAYTTPLTQARLKLKLQRKLYGQTSVQKYITPRIIQQTVKSHYLKPLFVSEMCVA